MFAHLLSERVCVCLHIVCACIRQETALLLSSKTGQTKKKKKAAKQIILCFPIFLSLPLSMHVRVASLCDQAQCCVYVCVKPGTKKRMVKPEVSYRL